MTVIRNRPPQQVRPTAPRTETVDVAARTTEVADRFEAAVGRNGRGNEQLVAGNVVGVVTAFVMNGAAMLGGVSNSMTGLGAAPTLRRQELQPTELVVPQRGLRGV